MARPCSKQRPFSRSCDEVGPGSAGYTLLELLLAMTIMLIASAMALSAAFGARRLYDADAARNELNQTLRSATDMIAAEVRQTAERLPTDFPAVELVDSVAGDRLTLRRHLVETTLQSCTNLAIAAVRIDVGLPAGVANCSILADNDGDGFPDNIQEFREYRLANGTDTSPKVLTQGYIYDPGTRLGEWFSFENEELDTGNGRWFLRLSAGLAGSYPAANQPRIYILDETRYDLTARTIELRRNGVVGAPLGVIDEIDEFQVALLLQDSTIVTAFTVNDDWSQIQSVQLQLAGQRTVRNRTVTRTMTADILPRNILSH